MFFFSKRKETQEMKIVTIVNNWLIEQRYVVVTVAFFYLFCMFDFLLMM